MNKFTIFTIILAVSVITVTVDLGVRDYFEKNSEASVLDAISDETERDNLERENPEPAPLQEPETIVVPPEQPEPSEPVFPPPSSSITQSKISEAGFAGQLSEKHFKGKVFQLLDITKNPVDAISFYEIVQETVPIISITEIVLRDEIRALQLYVLLQNKTKPYIDLTLNETNAYGDRSFYINHAKKPDEAFLTVKIGNRIYAFAYVKLYHPQLKKLIQLLSS
jgi:hypothetical protein